MFLLFILSIKKFKMLCSNIGSWFNYKFINCFIVYITNRVYQIPIDELVLLIFVIKSISIFILNYY